MTSPGAPAREPLRTFDWTTAEGPAQAVVSAVADVADEDPLDVQPIYGAVDPDALDEILAPSGPGRPPTERSVSFEYRGYDVVVTSNGRGYLYEQDARVHPVPGDVTDEFDE